MFIEKLNVYVNQFEDNSAIVINTNSAKLFISKLE